MSDIHLQKRIWFHLLCIILFVFPLVDNNDTKQLISCEQKPSRSLLFVSTLDGKISALDANNLGKKQWTLDLNGGPMLSSNIHHTELNNDGQWVRLIPSLRGGLYKFDGENLESIPISAVQLLHSSFRYSEDLVFSGGREVNSYGVSSATGKVLYECGINGCTNTNGDSYIEQDVLIVRRYQQTVRAVEPRTGIERWNFSVGQHDLVSISNSNIYCQNDKEAHTLDIEIKVVVPDGLIWATNRNNPKIKLWQYKFNSPIVTIWREDASKSNENNNLKEINLFDSMEWSRGTEFSTSPGIYLGVHDRQLYVQENAKLYKSLEVLPTYTQHLTYPWQPHLAIGNTIVKALPGPESNNNNDDNALLKVNDTQSPTALSVLYNSEYINGNGFYLYSQDQLQVDNDKQCNRTNINSMLIAEEKKLFMSNNTLEEDDTPVQIIIVSLWYWWKEVLIISITTAILLNFVLTQRLLNATTVVKDAVLPPLIVERHIETNKTSFRIINDKESIDKFKSRYLTDFEPVDCLGKGGYGVVFEAKNKIDDCNYAIKRIALPNSQSSRERVMREVKALAKLDHQNIVRYFNAWLECPPAGWQEKHDPEWINKLILPTDLTSHAEAKVNNFVCINVSQTDQSSVESACEAYDALHNSDLDEDSLVVFEKSHSTYLNKDVIDISNYSTESSNLSRSNNVTGKVLSKIDDCTGSDSIVFKDTNSNKHSEKDENRKRQRSFSLDLNNKSNTRKSPKMFLYIQMQLCQRLSLRDWLKNQSVQDYRHVLNIFQQIVEAVEYVHLQGLIHRDLKPSNIFFSFDNKIKVGDFGLVTAMTEGYDETHTPPSQNENITLKNSLHTAYVGTHLYMSPEQMKGQCYNYKVDIYSLGIILFELLIPFVTEMERITTLINLRKSLFPKDFDANHPAEYNLLKMMLDENPSNRPTTLGIKARAPLINYEIANGLGINEDSKWHFELPQLTRHSSMTNASSSESWENIT